MMWWTTERSPGRASAAWTHMSSLNLVGTRMWTYSTVPWAGTVYGSGISKTTSGVPIVQPSGNVRAAGISFGSPSGVPWSTQASRVARSRGAQAAVVLEVAVTRVGVPGGHPAVVDDLADHRRVPAGVVVSQERETARPGPAGGTTGTCSGRSRRRRRRRSPGRPSIPRSRPAPCSAATIAGAAGRTRDALPAPAASDGLGSTRSIRQPTTGVAVTSIRPPGEDRVEGIAQVMRASAASLRVPSAYWSSIAPR